MAEQSDADEDKQGYTFEQRRCRAAEELISTTLFNSYHPSLCQYELALEKTIKAFRCVPWDVPFPFKEGTGRVCDGRTAREFKIQLQNTSNSVEFEKCQWPVCNRHSYQTKVRQKN